MVYNIIVEVHINTEVYAEGETIEEAMDKVLDAATEYYNSFPQVELTHIEAYANGSSESC